jgi:hypothetical protein
MSNIEKSIYGKFDIAFKECSKYEIEEKESVQVIVSFIYSMK